MAPTEGRVSRPEQQSGCRRGTSNTQDTQSMCTHYASNQHCSAVGMYVCDEVFLTDPSRAL